MPLCPNCRAEVSEGEKYCSRCGTPIEAGSIGSDIVMVTTPSVPGFRVKNVLGIVTGLTARTRGTRARWNVCGRNTVDGWWGGIGFHL